MSSLSEKLDFPSDKSDGRARATFEMLDRRLFHRKEWTTRPYGRGEPDRITIDAMGGLEVWNRTGSGLYERET